MLYDVLWRQKDVSTERNISNAYKEENLVSSYVLCYFFSGAICVCNRLAFGISTDGLNFATGTYMKREFDRQNSPKIAQWARKKKKKKKKNDVVVRYLTVSLSVPQIV